MSRRSEATKPQGDRHAEQDASAPSRQASDDRRALPDLDNRDRQSRRYDEERQDVCVVRHEETQDERSGSQREDSVVGPADVAGEAYLDSGE